MHTTSCRLPKKPSELILLALNDLKKAENTPGYKVNMGQWHYGGVTSIEYDAKTCTVEDHSTPCEVCFAGSVMAFSLHAPPTEALSPLSFNDGIRRPLSALDSFRCGDLPIAFGHLDLETPKAAKALRAFGYEGSHEEGWVHPVTGGSVLPGFPNYSNKPAQRAKFHAAVRAMARKLAKHGL